MDGFQKWWSALTWPRKLMLIALTVMTLSQFADFQAPYIDDESVAIGPVGRVGVVPNLTTGVGIAKVGHPVAGVTGWQIHPYDWVILGALLLLFVTGLDLGQGWKRWGYWIAVVGLVFSFFPVDIEVAPGLGFLGGLFAIALGVVAARAHGREPKDT